MGVMCADDFYSGTVSAAFGGTTTVIPFAAQHRGMKLRQVVKDYHEAATPKAVIDYGFHLIITDPTPQALGQDLPALIRDGYTSFKIYMTYDAMKVSDYQMLDILALARKEGALVMVHCENHDMIQWLAHHLVEQGHGAPKFHAIAHARVAEAEATNRAISLARLVDAPMLIVHMSEIEAIETLRQAQKKGLKIFGETCPQYIALTADDMDKPGVEGAMWCCSPPPRDSAAQEAVWAALKDGTFQTFSSDHAPYQFNEKGKIPKGDKTTFKEMANGVPGLELRLPLLFSEGVQKGRISLQQFVQLGSTNHARLYGLYPRKGTIAVGSDADLAVWNPEIEKRIDRYKVAEIEAAADIIVWSCDRAPGLAPTRPQDLSFVGNIVDAMAAAQIRQLARGPLDLPCQRQHVRVAVRRRDLGNTTPAANEPVHSAKGQCEGQEAHRNCEDPT